MTLSEAAIMLRVSRATLWRFRKRYNVAVLTGRRIAVADLVRALDAERAVDNSPGGI